MHRFAQRIVRGCEREAYEVLANRTKCRARNGRDPRVLKHDAANLFGGQPSARDIDPCIEGTFGRGAVKARNLVEVASELLAASGELPHHARSRTPGVAQSLDGCALGELGDAGVGIDGEHTEMWTDR